VHQILEELIQKRLIYKTKMTGERGRYVYVRLDGEPTVLAPMRASVLSRLTPGVFSTSRNVGPKAYRILLDLQERGLVTVLKLGNQHIAALTLKAALHAQYDPSSAKAEPAKLTDILGEHRAKVIRALSVLERASGAELSYVMSPDLAREPGWSSSHIVASLNDLGLIKAFGRKRSYALTNKGTLIAAALNRSEGTLKPIELRLQIACRKSKIAARRAELVRTRSRTGELRSPAQRAVVNALTNHGPLTARELLERAELSLQNWRSLRLILRALEERGLVQRLQDESGNFMQVGRSRAFVWRTSKSSSMLRIRGDV
jgi:Fe2+ or Zn2+ uptake regulation protein